MTTEANRKPLTPTCTPARPKENKYVLPESTLDARASLHQATLDALHACQQIDDDEHGALAWALKIASDFLEGFRCAMVEEYDHPRDVPIAEALARVHQAAEAMIEQHMTECCERPGCCQCDWGIYSDARCVGALCVIMLGRWQHRDSEPEEADAATIVARQE